MTTARLIDGTEVPADSEAWRMECEARAILALPFGQRRAWIEDIERRRGKDEAMRLRKVIGVLFEVGKRGR